MNLNFRNMHTRTVPTVSAALVICSAALTGCQNPAPDTSIPPSTQRAAFQSQCGQNVVVCTTSWPVAVASVVAGNGQTVTEVSTNSYLVTVNGGSGGVPVQFRGSDSELGATATALAYEWSYGATDSDPCTLAPGTVVSTASDPELLLAPGFHYIRLHVVNDVFRVEVNSVACGVVAQNTGSFDFVELQVEVRRY